MIRIYISSKNLNNTNAAYAIILKDEKHNWELSFDCGNINSNHAMLHGLQYALHCIKPKYRSDEVSVFVDNKYASDMMQYNVKGYWERVPKQHEELINAIRKFLKEGFKKCSIVYARDDANVIRAKGLVDLAIKDKKFTCIRS